MVIIHVKNRRTGQLAGGSGESAFKVLEKILKEKGWDIIEVLLVLKRVV